MKSYYIKNEVIPFEEAEDVELFDINKTSI